MPCVYSASISDYDKDEKTTCFSNTNPHIPNVNFKDVSYVDYEFICEMLYDKGRAKILMNGFF